MHQLETLSIELSAKTSAEFMVSIRSLPYLADHGFLDMVVLPGSFYIDIALSMYMDHERFDRVTGLVRNVEFQNPVILSAEDTLIKVEVTDRGTNGIEYAFYETEVENKGTPESARRYAAKLEIVRNLSRADNEAFSIETFQAKSHAVIEGDSFYRTLRASGNQYGPGFQRVSSIWRAENESLGKLTVVQWDRQIEPHVVHPTLLDSITQLLAPFIIEMQKGKAFVLRAIEKVEVLDINFPDTLWAHATLLANNVDENGLVGNVEILDQSGKRYLQCSGVAVSLLDSLDAAEEKQKTTFAIAANFTAEPLEDSLNFWGDYFDLPVQLEFAPYNQLFQQLLGEESTFRKNRDGVNIILLSLEEWARANDTVVMTLDQAKAEQCFLTHARFVLPNDLEIVHLNQYETEYLYREIFEDECYLKHGISLQDGDTVIDIGANIGLFSLFAMSRCRDLKIYAFEPAPVLYELLKANSQAYGSNVHAVNAGVSDRSKTSMLTFYEKSSVFSGFHADEIADGKAIRAIVRSMLKSETSAENKDLDTYVDELTADRLSRKTYECQLTSISEIIREQHLEKIDLLKIDAEKSELEIINGIEDCDWPKIAQIVIEIHDPTGATVKRIEDLLTRKGFQCVVAQEKLLERSGLFNLYARRGDVRHHDRSKESLQRNLKDFCVALQSFMTQASAPMVLCVCPPFPSTEANPDLRTILREAEQNLISEARGIPNVHAISSESLLRLYPVVDYYDPHSRQLGHIPYTAECYAAIGTALSRTIFNLNATPYKVIVLDCDNTLWNGACGEVGPMGVEVGQSHRVLQEFMVDQMKAGKLLCLCSKNNVDDVLAVFDQRSDLILKREHLVSWRINWKSKSENIRSLAEELNLNVDSFIFIDDNPIECADVRINIPNVLTLQTPRRGISTTSFLNHVWPFDRKGSTMEDRDRTRFYQENAQRHEFQDQTSTLKAFIEGLQLRVEIVEASDDQLGRVSQLTFRTNQFNFTTIRRHEHELRDLLQREEVKCLAVRVADRFGDYGLVGCVIYEIEPSAYKVDTFLLSCRVLGRGVEYAVLANLGKRALQDGKAVLNLTCLKTGKNSPARTFINSIADQFRNESGTCWTIPAAYLSNLKYEPDHKPENGNERRASSEVNAFTHGPALEARVNQLSGRVHRIAEDLYDIGRVSKAIEDHRLSRQPISTDVNIAMATPLQTSVMNIWKKVLGRSQIGMNENFFEAGGTSLKAVHVVAMLKKELKQNLSIVSLFEYPTVALLAEKLSAASGESVRGNKTAAAVLRGQNRRTQVMRRRVH